MTVEGPSRSGRIVVVGSVNEDYMIRAPRRPLPGETVTGAVLERVPGGKGANQAVAAARLGAEVEIVAKVGSDSPGDLLAGSLEANGVGCRWLSRSSAKASGAAFVTVTPDGENTIVVAPGANSELGPLDVHAAGESLERASAVMAQLEIPLDAVRHAIGICGTDTLVLLNASPESRLEPEILQRVDVVVVNQHEAAALAPPRRGGSERSGPDAPRSALDHATSAAVGICAQGPRAAVVTLGADGSVAAVRAGDPDSSTSTWTCHVPATVAAQVVDTTGAGDAFMGALAARLVYAGAGRSPESLSRQLRPALEAAAAVAAVAVSRPGAQASFPYLLELGAPWQ